MNTRTAVALAIVLLIVPAAPSADTEPAEAPRLLDLGSQRHPISTRNPEAQRYFDQGLILTFGFNHEAAVRSFEHAARLDPDCAMCFWGIALALGPNINAPMGPGTQRWARVVEVTYDEPPEKVWEMRLKEDGVGWAIYRAERLPTLYP